MGRTFPSLYANSDLRYPNHQDEHRKVSKCTFLEIFIAPKKYKYNISAYSHIEGFRATQATVSI